MKTYFNTTHEPENQVERFTKINSGQDLNCLNLIKKHFKDDPFTSRTVYLKYLHTHFETAALETSIRRSMTALKRAGYIHETGNRVMGGHGRNVLEYKI